jgi:hypothetical protein
MAVRHRPNRRCRNCPEAADGLPEVPEAPVIKTTTFEGEGDGLWRAALTGCGTHLELLFRYVALDVPGDPLDQLRHLHARLGEIVEARERRTKQKP